MNDNAKIAENVLSLAKLLGILKSIAEYGPPIAATKPNVCASNFVLSLISNLLNTLPFR